MRKPAQKVAFWYANCLMFRSNIMMYVYIRKHVYNIYIAQWCGMKNKSYLCNNCFEALVIRAKNIAKIRHKTIVFLVLFQPEQIAFLGLCR